MLHKKVALLTLILVILVINTVAFSCFAYNEANASPTPEKDGWFAKIQELLGPKLGFSWDFFDNSIRKVVNWSKNSIAGIGEWLKERPGVLKESWEEEKTEWRETLDKYFKR